MRKTILALITCLSIFYSATAQDFNISLSEEAKFDATRNVVPVNNGFIAIERTGVRMQLAYTFKLDKVKHGITIRKFDGNMQQLKENALSNGDRNYGPFYPFLKRINDRIYLFYTTLGGEGSAPINFMMAEIDEATLTTKDPVHLLDIDQKNIGLFKAMELMDDYLLDIVPSPDKSKWLAYWTTGMDNSFNIAVFDNDMKQIWTKKVTINAASDAIVKSFCVDNNGVAYAAYKTGKGDIEIDGHVLICQPKKDMDRPLTFNDVHPYNILLVANSVQNEINVVGTYSNTKALTGVYSATLNTATFRLSQVKQTDFKEEFVKKMDDENWGSTKRKRFGISFLDMKAYALKDGSVDMIGEFRRTEQSLDLRHTAIISGSVINVRFAKEPVISEIPKARVSAGSTIGDSYYAFTIDDKMVVLYDDSEANLGRELERTPTGSSSYKMDVLVAAIIAPDGTITRKKVGDFRKLDMLAVTDFSVPGLNNNLFIPVQRIGGLGGVKKEFRWAKMEVK